MVCNFSISYRRISTQDVDSVGKVKVLVGHFRLATSLQIFASILVQTRPRQLEPDPWHPMHVLGHFLDSEAYIRYYRAKRGLLEGQTKRQPEQQQQRQQEVLRVLGQAVLHRQLHLVELTCVQGGVEGHHVAPFDRAGGSSFTHTSEVDFLVRIGTSPATTDDVHAPNWQRIPCNVYLWAQNTTFYFMEILLYLFHNVHSRFSHWPSHSKGKQRLPDSAAIWSPFFSKSEQKLVFVLPSVNRVSHI